MDFISTSGSNRVVYCYEGEKLSPSLGSKGIDREGARARSFPELGKNGLLPRYDGCGGGVGGSFEWWWWWWCNFLQLLAEHELVIIA